MAGRFNASTGNFFWREDLAFNQIQSHYVNLITLQHTSNFIISFSLDSAEIQVGFGIPEVEHSDWRHIKEKVLWK